jgi:Icc-related predicted phosphoesterase
VDGVRLDSHADVVVLAGDITEGLGGFRWARESFPDKPIVMVAGNHEFYNKNFSGHLDDMRESANTYDIDFLECDGIDIAGVRFLGCTLWTDFQLFGEDRKSDALKRARASMTDFATIKITRTPELYWVTGKYLMPILTERRHAGSVQWLSENLDKGQDPQKTVVVTHHAPHPNSIPDRYKENLLSAAYASDLTPLMGKASTWIHGHVHSSLDYTVNGTRIVANPRGYSHKNGGMENAAFNPALILEI